MKKALAVKNEKIKKSSHLSNDLAFYIIFLIIFSIVFFGYPIGLTYDSSEYIGLGDFIGTDKMYTDWIGHRGIAFPLIIRIFRNFGTPFSKYPLLAMMYLFYIIMTFQLYKIFEYFKNSKMFKIGDKIFFTIWLAIFIVINPLVFGYYHIVLTEFIALTIAIQTAYLCFQWLKISYDNNRKKSIIYCMIFCILTIFIYHIKQSLVPVTLVPITISLIISIIKDHSKKNVLYRILTFIIVIITLQLSVTIWNFFMKSIDTKDETEKQRINGRITIGLYDLKKVCNQDNFNDYLTADEIKKLKINEDEQFTIYKNSNNRLFAFHGDSKSKKKQLIFYTKVLLISPGTIFKSYYNGYMKMICFDNQQHKLTKFSENDTVPMLIYNRRSTAEYPNKAFEKYTYNYYKMRKDYTNIITKTFNSTLKLKKFIYGFTKISLLLQPIIFLIICIVEIILKIRKKLTNGIKNETLNFLTILYGQSIGIMMAYIIFGTCIDRYFIPAIISNYVADALLIILIIKLLEDKKIKENT